MYWFLNLFYFLFFFVKDTYSRKCITALRPIHIWFSPNCYVRLRHNRLCLPKYSSKTVIHFDITLSTINHEKVLNLFLVLCVRWLCVRTSDVCTENRLSKRKYRIELYKWFKNAMMQRQMSDRDDNPKCAIVKFLPVYHVYWLNQPPLIKDFRMKENTFSHPYCSFSIVPAKPATVFM